MMNKRERFLAAVSQDQVDRPPRTCWTHYMTELRGGEAHAARHLEFQNDHDWDIVKVVNDFYYELPAGMETITGPEDMEKFTELGMDSYLFAEELKCCHTLRKELGPDVPIIFTTFDPLRQITRRAGISTLPILNAHPDETERMLRKVSDSMCRFMVALREAGCDGIFFGVNSGIVAPSSLAISDEHYQRFVRPFELNMLEAMSGMVRILHVHGAPVTLDRFDDYPVEVISLSDRSSGNPSLKEVQERTGKAVMGGVDETFIHRMTPAELRDQIDEVIRQFDGKGLILAPGCTIPVFTPAHLIHVLSPKSL